MNRLRRLETFARAGWLARGIVYCLLAYLALTRAGSSDVDPQDSLRSVRDIGGGAILLAALAVGLAFYGTYRLYGAALDSEGKGTGAKGLAIRAGYVASGIAHFILAWIALDLALGHAGGGDGEQQKAARSLLDIPLGGALLGGLGLGFLAAAAHQATKAWTTEFTNGLATQAPPWVVPVGRAGLAARSVVFAIIGYSLVRAGWSGSPGEIKDFGGALAMLGDHALLHGLVAFGLLLFGIHSLVEARWRRIRDEDVIARLKAAVP